MSIEIGQLVSSGPALVVTFAGLIGVWFKFQNKVENLEKEDSEQGRQIDALWRWKDEHEKEASEMREKYQMRLSELSGEQRVVGEQFKQIMNALTEIKDRMAELEKGGR